MNQIRVLKKVLAISCAATFLASSPPARAQATATHGGARDRIDLAVPVMASVAARCGFGTLPGASVELGNLEAGFSREIPFVLQCNAPMRMAIRSSNGGLVAPVKAVGGQLNRLDYSVTLHIVGTGGAALTDSCMASTLVAASATPCSFAGTASATIGLRVPRGSNREQGSHVQVSAPPSSNLASSDNYTDALVLTLSPST